MNKLLHKRYIKDFNANLLDCEFLGQGHNGIVYRLPEGRLLKYALRKRNVVRNI